MNIRDIENLGKTAVSLAQLAGKLKSLAGFSGFALWAAVDSIVNLIDTKDNIYFCVAGYSLFELIRGYINSRQIDLGACDSQMFKLLKLQVALSHAINNGTEKLLEFDLLSPVDWIMRFFSVAFGTAESEDISRETAKFLKNRTEVLYQSAGCLE